MKKRPAIPSQTILPFSLSLTTVAFVVLAAALVWSTLPGLPGNFALGEEIGEETGEEPRVMPNLITPQSLGRTTFQHNCGYRPRFDLRADEVMVYGISNATLKWIDEWRQNSPKTRVSVMTGVAWGGYRDFLRGDFDGVNHQDDAQVQADGSVKMHDATTPYFSPSIAFADYLEARLKKVVDAGITDLYLEEPEFWAFTGFGESFKREWLMYYGENWIRPDSSCDAQYRASKLKRYLYYRLLDRVSTALKEYSLKRWGRPLRVYVATHSLLSYAQIQMVSPESALMDLPGIDGLIAQTWTGTARFPCIYNGVTEERTFETAFLEYNVMQEMVRGTGKRVYYLNDPVEDDPSHDWDDYQRNYLCTLTASLMQSGTAYYEVAPWPVRPFQGRYPEGSPDATPIPQDYATTLCLIFQQLRDMDQPDVHWENAPEGIGVFLSDSSMFQRAEPASQETRLPDDADLTHELTRPSGHELHHFSDFLGLTLPLLKHGIPVEVPILDHLLRYPGTLDKYRVLILSYEFQKPLSPGIHAVLADWVNRGGILIYVGAGTDPFHQAKDWWNQQPSTGTSPEAHLWSALGLTTPNAVPTDQAPAGAKISRHDVGAGKVFILRWRPSAITRSAENANTYRALVAEAARLQNLNWNEKNHFIKYRGPYVLASVLTESVSDEPLKLSGSFVNLFDVELKPTAQVVLNPGERAWLLDLNRVTAPAPAVLASSCRVESMQKTETGLQLETTSTADIEASTLLKLAAPPQEIRIDGEPLAAERCRWDESTHTLFFRFHSNGKATIEIR